MGRLRPAEAEEALSEVARSLGEKGRKGAVYCGLFGARAGGKLLGERPGPGSWLCPSLCYCLLHSFQGFDPGAKSSRCLRSWEQASCCVTSRPVTHSPPLARKALPLHLCSIILFLKGLPLYSPVVAPPQWPHCCLPHAHTHHCCLATVKPCQPPPEEPTDHSQRQLPTASAAWAPGRGG